MVWNTPIQIAGVVVKNRIVFPAISGNWAEADGSVSDKIMKFYRNVSEGGSGMIVVSGTAVSPEGKCTDHSLTLYNEKQLAGFKLLSETIKMHNSFPALQLVHAGGQGNPHFNGCMPVSPSGVKCKATGFDSQRLSISEIRIIRDMFVNSAGMAYSAGFAAVELHLAHGYLLHEFLSEHSNKRRDEYGGDITNRVRLVKDIISGVRKKLPDLIVGVRVSGEDFVEYGINEDINKQLLPAIEAAGAEYFSVTAGTYESSLIKHEAMSKGLFFNYARGIKKIVQGPVIGVGKILDLQMAEEHLLKKDCDLVAVGRGQIAEPMLVKKTINNVPIDRCTECEQCHYLRFGRRELTCSVRDW